jgi:hypothetical protein
MARSSPSLPQDEKVDNMAVPLQHNIAVGDIPRRRYFFGAQGKSLLRHIAVAGSIGFLLFGYDQGVLGVGAR